MAFPCEYDLEDEATGERFEAYSWADSFEVSDKESNRGGRRFGLRNYYLKDGSILTLDGLDHLRIVETERRLRKVQRRSAPASASGN